MFLPLARHDLAMLWPIIKTAVWRLKWLWLSIILLYGWIGQEPDFGFISLTGIGLGIERCLGLLIVVLYFVWLNQRTSIKQMQQAWYWLMQPLRWINISPARISLRIALTLDAVKQLQTQLTAPTTKLSLRDLPASLQQLMTLAINNAAQQSQTTTVDEFYLEHPAYWQWLYPIGLLMAFVLLSLLPMSFLLA